MQKTGEEKSCGKLKLPSAALPRGFGFILVCLLLYEDFFFFMVQFCCKSLPSILSGNETSPLNALLCLVGRWIASRKCKESRPRHWPDFSPSACRWRTAGSEYFLLPVLCELPSPSILCPIPAQKTIQSHDKVPSFVHKHFPVALHGVCK